ncbi:MAG: 4-hydroxy-tetrahydrodipicolinate synthase [Candidatus Thermoplasmatota archaeon]|nr:4-hydroxy-tetrahydrodipicolinate synthase [Candidatus Thermoplasmatota archaeon]MDP7265153.1 4-hydroxy-tetrahydrodipicolinate synthase [Candidatus Thermoplasmatota archaeon]
MKFEPNGVNPALVTPFHKDEGINEDGFRALIRSVISHVDGIVPCGTTGEFVYLSMAERKKLFEIAVDEANGKVPVIAGTGACSTRQAVELTGFAHDIGASAALIVGPYYLTPSDKGFYQHYRTIADSCPIPILMYNIPQVTGSFIPTRVIEDLSGIQNIVGLKDSSGDLTYTMEILDRVRDRINVMIGHDEVVLPALAAGCSGMILASAQVFPDIWQRVYKAVRDNDLGTARELQMKVQKLTRMYCRMGGSVPLKASLRMMGIPAGRARRPLMEGGSILHEDIAEIRVELEKLGKIPRDETGMGFSIVPIGESLGDLGLSAEDLAGKEYPHASSVVEAGNEKVSVHMVAGNKEGKLGRLFAYQLTYPRHGYEALTTILEPNLAVRPSTLIIPGVKQKNLRQANMIFGPVQSACAKAIADSVELGVIPESQTESVVMIAKVFLSPRASAREIIYKNSYSAFITALKELFSVGGGE